MQRNATVLGGLNIQMARLAVAIALLLSGPLNVAAQQGVLNFRGQVVNPTCDVDTLHAARLVEQALRLQVHPGQGVAVNHAAKACQAEAQVQAFSTHFQPLADADSQRVSESAGILTITYQ